MPADIDTALGQFAIDSPACDAMLAADHPPHEEGGPCHDCAFRRGSEASQSQHTMALARLCVEGLKYFDCHVHPGLCRGWIAAVNLRGAPVSPEDNAKCDAAGKAADLLGDVVSSAAKTDALAALRSMPDLAFLATKEPPNAHP